ncbi:calcium uniporter regulatory subunit MCUb, mitochondrial isoform X1 [Ammospiza nelsoni]|uniref:calcium uniporter regulatory subunit MCUb, mitochondrial isoform X1 n=1 Tax=Ammospiza nelsoni TaxID=2857394 RepID=UPI00286A2642|nr:calcium uniporter regulatory subunit MCUb, mitochondrial isoform X1 [Ammospiza nelsoni]
MPISVFFNGQPVSVIRRRTTRRRGASSTCKPRPVLWARRGEGSSESPPPGTARAAGRRERHSPARPGPSGGGREGAGGRRTQRPSRRRSRPRSPRSVSPTPSAARRCPARGAGRRGRSPPGQEEAEVGLWRHAGAWRGREGAPYSTLVPSDEVTINYRHGLPVITLMLPTRSERCQFTVKPVVTTVGAFLQDVQREDKGIERAEVFAVDGSKVSDATLMEVLLMNDFKLVINNTAYSVSPPVKDKLSSEHATEMEDIKSLVHRLFVALHVEDHQIRKERELLQKLDHLKGQLLPLEQMKARIMDSADAKTSRLLWVGLALMSTQGGALAWLTWWVYSWDIMEPVTYFITYGSAMAFYAYFILTKQDYIYPHAKDRQFLHYFYRKSKKQRFNVERYNKLRDDVAEAEESLRRLRQPLYLRLPIQEISDKD